MKNEQLRVVLDDAVRFAPWILIAASCLVLGSAFIAEGVFDLRPCALCIYQRWPYIVIIASCLTSIALPSASAGRAALLGVAALACTVGAVIAAFHIGVEQRWWPGPSVCDSVVPLRGGDMAALREQLMTTPLVRCDVVQWRLFGLSLAGYNMIASLGLAALGGFAVLRISAKRMGSLK